MAIGYLDDSKLTAIADSIRSKTGKSATITVDEMPDEIEGIETGGGGDMNALIGRTISGTMTDNDVTIIGTYAFAGCSKLTGVSFANATVLSANAFANCYSLQSAYIPNVTTIQGSCFYRCSSLQDVVASSCAVLQDRAFDGCIALSAFSAPNLTDIRGSAFASCGLIEFSASNVSTTSSYVFYNCKSLLSVSFASIQAVGSSCFYGCNSLSAAFLGSRLTMISASAFYSCWRLTELHLESVSAIPNLQNSSVFTSTPIAGFTSYTGGVYGSIYVPSDMYGGFSTAANWSFFKSRMVSV